MGLFGGKPNIKKMKNKGDIDGLIKSLSHNDVMIRQEATEALLTIFSEMSVVVGDREIDVWPRRVAANELLRKISSEAGEAFLASLRDSIGIINSLNEAIGSLKGLPDGGRMMLQISLCSTLEKIGDRRFIVPLQRLAEALKDDRDRSSIKKTLDKLQKLTD